LVFNQLSAVESSRFTYLLAGEDIVHSLVKTSTQSCETC